MVVAIILDMTSVTDATMVETSRPMTGCSCNDPITLSTGYQARVTQTRLLNGECVTCMSLQLACHDNIT